MNTIFMNSGNSKTSDPHRLSLNLMDKIDLRRKDKYIALSNFSIYISSNIEQRIWTTWWIIFYIRYSRLFWIYIKEHGEKKVNPSVKNT